MRLLGHEKIGRLPVTALEVIQEQVFKPGVLLRPAFILATR